MNQFLVIIPTYNEKENIKKLIPEILAISNKNNKILNVLVVDDNSPDKTYEEVKGFSGHDSRVYLLHRLRKEGLGKAYEAGFKWAMARNYDFVISMDADFSHQPKYLQNMIDGDRKIDVLSGSRYIKGGGIEGWNWQRYLNSYGANFFTRFFLGIKIHDVTSGFKRYNRLFIQALLQHGIKASGYALMVETIFFAKQKGFSAGEFPIVFIDRKIGETKIAGELKKSIIMVINLIARRHGVRQLGKFLIVGGICALIDWLCYFFFRGILPWREQTLKQIAKGFAFVVSALSNFFGNRYWTFRATDKNIHRQLIKFFIIATGGLVWNNLIFYIVTGILKLPDIYGLIIATGLVTFWNFLGNRRWTFRG